MYNVHPVGTLVVSKKAIALAGIAVDPLGIPLYLITSSVLYEGTMLWEPIVGLVAVWVCPVPLPTLLPVLFPLPEVDSALTVTEPETDGVTVEAPPVPP